MPRKLVGTMKVHIRNTAHYLSDIVTTPDPNIEAYVALLKEMETQGSALLIEGEIPKTYKDSAAYLRLLTSYEDQINQSNSTLESSTSSKLANIMQNVPDRDYTKTDLDGVIRAQSKLLVSYIVLQGQRTALLKQVVDRLASAPEGLLLRHGSIRQSNGDGARLLSGKNTDQLTVTGADPVVERKVQIKIVSLMEGLIPDNQKELMYGVISDATRYLAVHLLEPRVIQVCKCMKSVFVQCELWCDEIFKRMSRPCCTCSRQLMVDTLADLAPGERIVGVSGDRAFAPSVDISVRPCSRTCTAGLPCPASAPTEGCQTSYMLYSTEYDRQRQYLDGPTKLERSSENESTIINASIQASNTLPHLSSVGSNQHFPSSSSEELTPECIPESSSCLLSQLKHNQISYSESKSTTLSYCTIPSSPGKSSANTSAQEGRESSASFAWRTPVSLRMQTNTSESTPIPELEYIDRTSPDLNGIPIVSTDQMCDWHSMMMSLAWNLQAWRKWIQETMDRALSYQQSNLIDRADETWNAFRRKIATETLQWRQYNIFSRQLILRLSLRYQDKKIVSPTRGSVKNKVYSHCQNEMLRIIDMFNKWTHTICVINTLFLPEQVHLQKFSRRWNYFKSKVEEYAEDWKNYYSNLFKLTWENQFMGLIPEWVSLWKAGGPVWVVSACGAVPSGAVSAGTAAGEPIWVARTTHKGQVLPAALYPSKHCCVLYAQGAVHHYTKYQVLCNAAVEWVPWRAGAAAPARAVAVAPRVLAGRVRHRGAHLLGAARAPARRCHVVILGRPFAVNTYELLVLADPNA